MAPTRSKKNNSDTAFATSPYSASSAKSIVSFSAEQNSASQIDNLAALIKLYSENSEKIKEIEEKLHELEKTQVQQSQLQTEVTKTSKTSRISIILLMIVPLVQLFICATIIIHFGKQEQLPNLLNHFLTGISVISIGEAILIPVKMYFDSKKNAELEDRIKKLEESKE